MKCANCPVNDGYCVFANPKQVRCPIPLLRERRIKAHKGKKAIVKADLKNAYTSNAEKPKYGM